MTGQEQKTSLRALYAQIEQICSHFKEIRSEASGIMETSGMPDATLHLNDVLESTEQAATVILEAATAIGYATDNESVPAGIKDKINEQVGRIYEAASFQDISGQRIKKVLTQLAELENQLQRLSETARNAAPVSKPRDTLLNGPQLSTVAPSQDDVDKLFGSS